MPGRVRLQRQIPNLRELRPQRAASKVQRCRRWPRRPRHPGRPSAPSWSYARRLPGGDCLRRLRRRASAARTSCSSRGWTPPYGPRRRRRTRRRVRGLVDLDGVTLRHLSASCARSSSPRVAKSDTAPGPHRFAPPAPGLGRRPPCPLDFAQRPRARRRSLDGFRGSRARPVVRGLGQGRFAIRGRAPLRPVDQT